MSTKIPYSYVVLRYVHDVLTGEFVNVGLIITTPKDGVVLSRGRKTFGRIKNVFPDLDSGAYKRAIESIERGMREVRQDIERAGLFRSEKNALSLARLAMPSDDSSLQWSPVGGGLTSDVEKTFEQLYARFVSQYDRPSKRLRSDEDVWRVVASKLKERDVQVDLQPKQVRGVNDAVEFKHAWKNGRWHVYEPLSFDLSDADNIKDKARRWLGHLAAVKNGDTVNPQVHFIVGKPQQDRLLPAYKSAIEILKQVPFEATVFEEEEIDEVVLLIEDEVRHHQAQSH